MVVQLPERFQRIRFEPITSSPLSEGVGVNGTGTVKVIPSQAGIYFPAIHTLALRNHRFLPKGPTRSSKTSLFPPRGQAFLVTCGRWLVAGFRTTYRLPLTTTFKTVNLAHTLSPLEASARFSRLASLARFSRFAHTFFRIAVLHVILPANLHDALGL
jgi:hypothetical protein